MKINPLALASASLVTLLVALSAFHIPQARPVHAPPRQTTSLEVSPSDIGGGVVYFPATGDTYMLALAKFYKLFPGRRCELQGFTETAGVVSGFILRCRDIAVDAQTITVP